MSRSKPKPTIEELLRDLVPHPRFDCRPASDAERVSDEDALQKYGWPVLGGDVIFPESAIRSELARMASYGAIPPNAYVDTLRECKDCERRFIFFAREQQHWYEERGFHAGEGGRRCFECRRARQLLHSSRRDYSEFANLPPVEFADIGKFLRAAITLWEAGELVDEQKLRRVAKLAKAEAPTVESTKQLLAIVDRLNAPTDETSQDES